MGETAGPAHFPLSLEQEWFYGIRLAEPRGRISVSLASDIRGPLDVKTFLAAAREVFAHHPGLRARLAFTGEGEPLLRVAPATAEIPVTCQAVIGRSRQQFEAYARSVANRDQRARWNPVAGPLLQLRLLRRDPREHLLLSTFDHVAFDLRAAEIFERDLWQVYRNLTQGRAAGLTGNNDLAGCVRRQRRRYAARASGANAAFWSSRYAIAPPVWQPSGPRRPGLTYGEREQVVYSPSPDLVAKLKAACGTLPCLPLELCLAVFATLVFRLTLQDRLAIFATLDSRESAEKDVIGMFTGVRPLILDRAAPDPRSYLGQVKKEVFRALARRHLTGAGELAAQQRQRATWHLEGRRALAVDYLAADSEAATFPEPAGIEVRPERFASLPSAASAALALAILDLGGEMRVSFLYTPQVIDRETATALLALFDAGLSTVVTGDGAAGAGVVPGPTPAGAHAAGLAAFASDAGALTPLHDADGATCLHADLAEVRGALLSHPGVTSATVWAEHGEGRASTVMATVGAAAAVTDEELREHCRRWPGATQYLVPPGTIHRPGERV